ncbi:helix-turn-helix domain-containing protein [Desulfocurvus sp. DL9XJH121]
MSEICLVGTEEIGKAIGVGRNEVARLVREQGLPAWQEGPRGKWRALPEDLKAWLRERREKMCKIV